MKRSIRDTFFPLSNGSPRFSRFRKDPIERWRWGLFLVLLSSFPGFAQEKPNGDSDYRESDLFVAGEGGVHTYRIPALIRSASGTLLAFAEARYEHPGDHGHLEVVVRRSPDGGETWGPIEGVCRDGLHAVQNPTAVLDRETGTLWLFLVRTDSGIYGSVKDILNSQVRARSTWVVCSRDDGRSWSAPRDITSEVYLEGTLGSVPGPGIGIQTTSGRIVIPSYARKIGTDDYFCFCMYSNDHGKTWKTGNPTEAGVNECQVVELDSQVLLLNMRSNRDKGVRAVASSGDQGHHWGEIRDDPVLVEPVCQASLLRLPAQRGLPAQLLFSNPAEGEKGKRRRLTVRLSLDDGATWAFERVLHPGFSAYSCLAAVSDESYCCLYEKGETGKYERISLARFSSAWLRSAPTDPGR